MSFYRTGTLSLTNGSATVTGSGTDFISGAAIGECVQAPDGKLYEVASIQSATGLTLGSPYLGATASGQTYSIIPTQSYIRDLAGQAATLVNSYSSTQANALTLTATDKTSIVDADKLGGRDSVTGLSRLFTWSGIKAAIAALINGGTIPGSFTSISAAPGTVAELGRFLDFHTAANGLDYDFRIDVGAGTGVAGTSAVVFNLGSLALTGPLITPVGVTSASGTPSLTTLSAVALPSTLNAYNLLTSDQSNGASFIQNNKWIRRNTEGGVNWETVSIREGIAVEGSFATPITALCWNEKNTSGLHTWGNGGNIYASLNLGGLTVAGAVEGTSVKTANGDVRIGNGGNASDNGGSVLFAINDSFFGPSALPMSSIAGILKNATAGELQGGISFRTRPHDVPGQLLTERMRLESNGNLLVGTTVNGNPLNGATLSVSPGFGVSQLAHPTGTVAGSAYTYFLYDGGAIGSITQSGTTAVAYNTTSDHRLKTNVRPANAARFMDIEFVDFEWTDGRHDCGVIADQLQSVYPDLVRGVKDATEIRQVEITPAVPAVLDEEGIEVTPAIEAVTEEQTFPVYQQVNYIGLIGRMGTTIQKQQRLLEVMEARLAALEAA